MTRPAYINLWRSFKDSSSTPIILCPNSSCQRKVNTTLSEVKDWTQSIRLMHIALLIRLPSILSEQFEVPSWRRLLKILDRNFRIFYEANFSTEGPEEDAVCSSDSNLEVPEYGQTDDYIRLENLSLKWYSGVKVRFYEHYHLKIHNQSRNRTACHFTDTVKLEPIWNLQPATWVITSSVPAAEVRYKY